MTPGSTPALRASTITQPTPRIFCTMLPRQVIDDALKAAPLHLQTTLVSINSVNIVLKRKNNIESVANVQLRNAK
jgi:hypothetical protein